MNSVQGVTTALLTRVAAVACVKPALPKPMTAREKLLQALSNIANARDILRGVMQRLLTPNTRTFRKLY